MEKSTGTRFTAMDIAQFFIQLASDLGDDMDVDKLNYLLYYSQAWSLAKRGEPLFDDEIIAGEDGPKIPAVYEAFINSEDAAYELGRV